MKLLALLLPAIECAFLKETDFNIPLKKYVERYNFQLDEHNVQTRDGFLLLLHRVVSPSGKSVKGPPVLLMHGLEGSSADFLLNYPEMAPALTLAKKGYDVWLGNSRGNEFSSRHDTLKPEDIEGASVYWNFGPEDIGNVDVPAFIDFILKETKKPKLEAYIGYELGNTEFWMGASRNPHYFEDTVNLFVSLSPFVQIQNKIDWFQALMGYMWVVWPKFFQQTLGFYSFWDTQQSRKRSAESCTSFYSLCVITNSFSYDQLLTNIERLPFVLRY